MVEGMLALTNGKNVSTYIGGRNDSTFTDRMSVFTPASRRNINTDTGIGLLVLTHMYKTLAPKLIGRILLLPPE